MEKFEYYEDIVTVFLVSKSLNYVLCQLYFFRNSKHWAGH